jgi:hypothetical protein
MEGLSQSLPSTRFLESCEDLSCQKGYYFDYDLDKKDLTCLPCGINTYSLGGNFRLKGSLNEWTPMNKQYQKLQKHCYSRESQFSANELKDVGCTGWAPSSKGDAIQTFPTPKKDMVYTFDLSLSINMVRNGTVTFTYFMDSTRQRNRYVPNGTLKFFVNYLEKHFGYEQSRNWVTVTFQLTKGLNNLLWEYSKEVNLDWPGSEKMGMKIEMIEIEGMNEGDSECKSCMRGYATKEGSYECQLCRNTEIFNETTVILFTHKYRDNVIRAKMTNMLWIQKKVQSVKLGPYVTDWIILISQEDNALPKPTKLKLNMKDIYLRCVKVVTNLLWMSTRIALHVPLVRKEFLQR